MNERVLIKDIENAIGGYDDELTHITFGTTEKTVEVAVRKRLPLADRKRFADAVVDMCFVDDEDGDILYCPYLKKFAFEYNIALFFTNIELSGEVEEVCEFLARANIAHLIATSVGENYIGELLSEVNELIEYHKKEILKRSKIDDVLGSISEMAKTLNSKLSSENGESIMNYFEDIMPGFKDEIVKVLQEQQETNIINK